MKRLGGRYNRRTLLSLTIVVASVGLAGCTSPGESEESGDDGDTGGDSDEGEDGGGGGGGGYNSEVHEQPTLSKE